jgi:hypothetical protein
MLNMADAHLLRAYKKDRAKLGKSAINVNNDNALGSYP